MTRPPVALRRTLTGLLALGALLSQARPAVQADDPGSERERQRLLDSLLSKAAQPDGERVTPEQVRRAFGVPRHLARQLLAHRYLEQWSYDRATPLRLEFEFVAGQPPRLVRVQRLRPDSR